MKGTFFALCAAAFAFQALPASAESIFSESFQSGEATRWAPSGGDVRLTTYAGNVSMRLTHSAAVVTAVSTQGYGDVVIAAAVAANDLEGEEYCLVEASADGGHTWIEVLRLADGQDDGVTMHRNAVRDARFNGVERLLIGARVAGNANNDQCWLDDVRVSGARIEASQTNRQHLSAAWLRSAETQSALIPMREFAPAPGHGALQQNFEGMLRVAASRGQLRPVEDAFRVAADNTLHADTLPAFEMRLVQDGEWLVPERRGPVAGSHPNWEIAIEPGRVWSEVGDSGWNRAALPFALIETNANCTHNGVLTFAFRGGEISRVAWQIASETCAYFKFDFWGVAQATYTPGSSAEDAALITAFRAEREGRMRVEPFSALAARGVDIDAFASPADIDPAALTTFGLIYDGVHYRGGCDTRAGPYPFCEALLLPSYSLAKSIAGGFGLMRLELIYPGVRHERIADHVRACAAWDGVTLDNALDMATGRYESALSEADEAALPTSRFFLSTTLEEKLNISCSLYPRRAAPGSRWVYHTPDTFVLGAAMADAWRARRGANRDFFDDVLVSGVYEPLHLSPTIRATRRTYDETRQPFIGWGLTILADDIAKISAYLQHPEVAPSLLEPAELAAAMQRAPEDRGLPGPDESFRYNNGFWALNVQGFIGCAHPVWAPFMSGYGGIVVVLMPNGVTYYYVSDGGEYRWVRAVRAANRLASMCEASR